ncbi:ABC transporter substrate-binding protein [Amycolatopsis decaplanina]|uniref:Family 5 extracellular solute-binding protein n=1 Tax=Amycolatopsis decaplanina DSM 44594 TaxID=1284240 RepID=M2Y9X7_9PSEU|nr:ABC transporter substrate-binding protein [Amycolatopsis decaplanina]EME51702.1 family 5 extracellular solute-binding protein [Amycolatopsis decaplanina DSM 44594]
MSINRRVLFRTAGLAAGVAGAGAFLNACGTSIPASGPVRHTVPSVARSGGVLRAVFTGGGAAESLDPFGSGSPVDFVRGDVVFDSLFTLSGGEVVPALATGIEVGPGATSFVLTLREGVKWHDGSPFTADDVAYSFRFMSSPERAYPSQLSAYFDFDKLQIRDPFTLVVPARRPVGDPALFLAAFPGKMVKNGATFTGATAIGTGAYQVTVFEAGRESRLKRFDGHWSGKAPADELVLLSLSDPQAKVNAVVTGQADYAGDIPFITGKAGVAGNDFEVRTAGEENRTAYGWVLNTTRKPFDDPRARKAVRLAISRRALVDTVLLGYGVPGNDLLCAGAKYFTPRDVPARDLDQARKLVKESGADATEIVIRTAEWEIGYNASTQLLVEQLKEAGLKVRADIVSPPEFFEPNAVGAANAVAFSSGAVPLAVIYGRLAAYPPLALKDDGFTAAFGRAIGSADEAERAKAWKDAQEIMYDRGNTVVWGQADVLSLARKAVAGITVRDQAKYPYLGKAGLA